MPLTNVVEAENKLLGEVKISENSPLSSSTDIFLSVALCIHLNVVMSIRLAYLLTMLEKETRETEGKKEHEESKTFHHPRCPVWTDV